MSQLFKIAIKPAHSFGFRAKLLSGINRYMREHSGLTLNPSPKTFLRLDSPSVQKVDGYIADVYQSELETTRQFNTTVLNIGRPAIDVPLPTVTHDDALIGKMAAKHFLSRGFSNFWGLTIDNLIYGKLACDGFSQEIKAHGHEYKQFDLEKEYSKTAPCIERFKNSFDQLLPLLRKSKSPIALFSTSPHASLALVNYCESIGVSVPEELSILSSDRMACQSISISFPSVSTVEVDLEEIGYQASQMLHSVLKGEPLEQKMLLLPPTHIVERGSTINLYDAKPDAKHAIDFMHTHAFNGITVEQIQRYLGVSNRKLYNMIKKETQQAPHQYLLDIRIKKAKELLANTNTPVGEIAIETGFSEHRNFTRAFQKNESESPSEYRKRHR